MIWVGRSAETEISLLQLANQLCRCWMSPHGSSPSRKSNYIGYCHGFVSGVADTTQNANLMGIQRGQMVRVVEKYLVDHPEKLSLVADFLVREALEKAFPRVPKK